MRRFHPITYPIAPRDSKRPLKLHQRRDLCAGLELASALYELGFGLGHQILSRLPPQEEQIPPRQGEPYHVDITFVRPGDLLLQFTRPPFSDIKNGAKRKVLPVHTDLELILFQVWKRFLAKSARDHMEVVSDLHPGFLPDFVHCREMSFKQQGWGAPYYRVNDQRGSGLRLYRGPRKTALFLLHLQEAWKGGPGYLAAFGMDGCTTLAWAHRLARDFRHLLEKPGFVVAELELGEIPEHPTDLRFCEDWKITPALVHDLTPEPVLA